MGSLWAGRSRSAKGRICHFSLGDPHLSLLRKLNMLCGRLTRRMPRFVRELVTSISVGAFLPAGACSVRRQSLCRHAASAYSWINPPSLSR